MMQRDSIAIFLTLMLLIPTLSIVSADEEDIPEKKTLQWFVLTKKEYAKTI